MLLDPHWTSPTAPAQGFHTFLYNPEIEFILVKTDSKVEFRRIVLTDTGAQSAYVGWDNRSDEQYYIFRVDPAQKIIVAGSSTVRFFRCPKEKEQAPSSKNCPFMTRKWAFEKPVRPWEAEDVYQQRDVATMETFPPEHLLEVARRFKAWRAMTTGSLSVYLMVPKQLSEAEWTRLFDGSVQFFDDVPWVL